MSEQKLDLNNSEKLTDWENEPSLNDLQTDFTASKAFHTENCTKIDEWVDILNVSGSEKRFIPKSNTQSKVQPKLVRRQNEWRYPALSEPFLNSDKIFSVLPRTFEDKKIADQNELLLNYQFDTKLNKVKFIDELVRNVVDKGTAIIRVGWNRETKIELKDQTQYAFIPVQDPTILNQLQQLVQASQQNPREYKESTSEDIQQAVDYFMQSGIPVQAIPQGTFQVEEEVLVENCPTVELVNPNNIYIDPSCKGDANKALFIIHAFETNKAELQKDGRYTNLDKINWDSAAINTDTDFTLNDTETDFNFSDATRKKVIAYEYWGYYDIHNNGSLVPIVATWIDNVIIRMEENPFPDGKLPFVFIPYSPKINSVYGEPDAELLKDNQRILGAVTRGMIDLFAKSANGQRGFAKGMLDPINKRKFQLGEDYEFNSEIPPTVGYLEHTFPELPQSAFLMIQQQNQEAESLTGVKAFSGGLSGEAYGQVAAGIRGMLDASAKREMSILRRLAKGMVEVGNKIVAMNAIFLSDEEVIRITNEQFVSIKREDIKGNFDLKVDINTAEVDNTKAQDLAFMLQTIGPNLDPKITLNIMAEIAKLKRMPDLAKTLANYQPQPDPMEQQLKQLELQKLQSEIMYNQARANKAAAEAQEVSVDTQQTASGIKHEQEMDKQRAQASANQDLEITKALVKPLKQGEAKPDVQAAIGWNSLTKPENN